MKLAAKFFTPLIVFTCMHSMSGQRLQRSDPYSVGSVVASYRPSQASLDQRPFSRGATFASVSSLGGQLQLATNLNRQIGLRGTYGWLFLKRWETYRGFTTHGLVSMGSMGMMLDFYPFPDHALRFTPGVLFHNAEVASGDFPLTAGLGGAFTLNGHKYYSAAQPVKYDPNVAPEDQGPVHAYEGVNLRRTAFTISAGWGNLASSRNDRHWTFPIELGVALLGSPTIKTGFISGQLCEAAGQNCIAASKSPQLRQDLEADFAGYRNHLPLLKTYPIVSAGIAYRFDWKLAGRH
ncbi:MAG: hypothetical protein JST28_08110 [Acidobacteria bacterium]|nr:hypothetical protein [Acidobacteriota bacterium]